MTSDEDIQVAVSGQGSEAPSWIDTLPTELPYIEFPPADMKGALLGAGMSEEAASLIVDMQLALNEGRPFDGVQRTAESTTPTRLEQFLKNALSQ
jgi:hypothetical protein